MMAILYIVIALAIFLAVFAFIVSQRPASFEIARSITINAPPEQIFPLVNDLHAWAAWSPYEKMDPNMLKTFSGADSGTGATYAWEGNKKVGAGRMTIVKSEASSLIESTVQFLKPFPATNTARFSFVPMGDGTKVTWAMLGKSNFMAKAFGMFVNIDKMVGTDFARGLEALKSVVENSASASPA